MNRVQFFAFMFLMSFLLYLDHKTIETLIYLTVIGLTFAYYYFKQEGIEK